MVDTSVNGRGSLFPDRVINVLIRETIHRKPSELPEEVSGGLFVAAVDRLRCIFIPSSRKFPMIYTVFSVGSIS